MKGCAHDCLPVHEVTSAAIRLPAEMAQPGLQVEEPWHVPGLCGHPVFYKVHTLIFQ